MRIDAHAHLGSWIVDGRDYGYDKNKMKKEMKKFKIDKTCLLPVGLDKLFKIPEIRKRRPDNNFILEMCEKEDSLIPIFWVNPFNKEEIIQALNGGFKGLKYHAEVHLIPISDKILEFAVESAKEFKVPFFVHTNESSENTSIFRVQEVAEKYPEVNFLALHSINKVNTTCFEAKKRKLYDIDNIYYCTGGRSLFLEFKMIYENVGPNHIVFSTDSPFGHPEIFIKNIELLTDDRKERKMIFGANIQKILKL